MVGGHRSHHQPQTIFWAFTWVFSCPTSLSNCGISPPPCIFFPLHPLPSLGVRPRACGQKARPVLQTLIKAVFQTKTALCLRGIPVGGRKVIHSQCKSRHAFGIWRLRSKNKLRDGENCSRSKKPLKRGSRWEPKNKTTDVKVGLYRGSGNIQGWILCFILFPVLPWAMVQLSYPQTFSKSLLHTTCQFW